MRIVVSQKRKWVMVWSGLEGAAGVSHVFFFELSNFFMGITLG